MSQNAEYDAPRFDPNDILRCEAEAITWGRCTLLRGHNGWHRAAFDGGRRWPSTQRVYTEQEVWSVLAEHHFIVSPTAYGQESCACGWCRDGWDAPSFEAHLASRLGLLAPTQEARHG